MSGETTAENLENLKVLIYGKAEEEPVKKIFIVRVLRLIYSNHAVSHLRERMCREMTLFSGGLCSSRTKITLKHFPYHVGHRNAEALCSSW